MAKPSLTITNDKASELEFDVSIHGVPNSEARVRFVLEGTSHDTTINCVLSRTNKWLAHIPAMRIDETVKSFRLEVIAGEYYFCPANGDIRLVSSPSVKVTEMHQAEKQKPISVSASFSVDNKQPQLIILENLSPEEQKSTIQHYRAAGKIFSKAALVCEQKTVSTNALVGVMEAVRKAMKLIETKLYSD